MTVPRMASRYSVIAAKLDQLINVLFRYLLRTTELVRYKIDFCEKLNRLHLVLRTDEIRSHRQCAVILQQHSIMILDVRGDGLRNLVGRRRAIRCDWNRPQ